MEQRREELAASAAAAEAARRDPELMVSLWAKLAELKARDGARARAWSDETRHRVEMAGGSDDSAYLQEQLAEERERRAFALNGQRISADDNADMRALAADARRRAERGELKDDNEHLLRHMEESGQLPDGPLPDEIDYESFMADLHERLENLAWEQMKRAEQAEAERDEWRERATLMQRQWSLAHEEAVELRSVLRRLSQTLKDAQKCIAKTEQ